jgi:hypothetical protein
MSLRKVPFSIAAGLLVLAATGPMARAAYTVTFQQEGSNVVATGSGTLNISGLIYQVTEPNHSTVFPGAGLALIGPATSADTDEYTSVSFSGPFDFGSGDDDIAGTSGSGNLVGIAFPTQEVLVPQGYVSGAALSDTSTWSGQTFSTLGITPGTYTWTWGSGATADSFTLETVPEPASGGLVLGAAMLLAIRRRRRSEVAAV